MDIAKERERALEVSQNGDRIKRKLKARSSGKVHRDSRNDELRDRDLFQEIQDSLRLGMSIKLASRSGHGVIKRKVPLHVRDWRQLRADDRKEMKLHTNRSTWLKTMWVPHWDHTGDLLKGLSWAIALHQQNARTLNVNLGPEVIEAGRSHSHGFATYVRRRISRHLKVTAQRLDVPVPEFFFIIEDSDLGDAHLHGAILMPTTPRLYKAFRSALRDAGGNWHGGGSARQVDTREMDTPVRWIAYINKWRLGSALRIGGKSFAATQGVRTMGRIWYQEARSTGAVLLPGWHYLDTGLIPIE